MNETNNFKIGLFICTGTIIFIAGLFMVGLRDHFESKFNVFTYTVESVQGLESGSPVKYQGVSIGKVEDILIVKKNYVQIIMSIKPSSIMDSIPKDSPDYKYLKSGVSDKDMYEVIKLNVKQGLRCKVDYAGITGMKYVEMYYSQDPPLPVNLKFDDTGYIPSTGSFLAGTVGNMQEALTKISAIDFERIEKDLNGTLIAVKNLAANPDLAKAIVSFNEAMIDLKKTSAELRTEVNTGGAELKKTLRSARLLIDMLEEDPASIISGKQKKR